MKNLIKKLVESNQDKIVFRAMGNIIVDNNENPTYFSLLKLASISISKRKDTIIYIQYDANTDTYVFDLYEEKQAKGE